MKKAGKYTWAAAAMAAAWAVVQVKARQAERQHPPRGQFIMVDGVRLHYLSKGEGQAVVLLHGNGVTAEDFRNCGLLGQLAAGHRVIAFDRPGFGYSDRPRGTVWTPAAQAALLARALSLLGVRRAVVLGHSWGTLVALAMARAQPRLVAGLVLASGYYYPSLRLDVLSAAPAVPIVGDLMRYTVSPLAGRLLWPLLVKRAFHPAPVPPSFRRLPPWMMLRPGQLRAEAAETAMMIPSAAGLQSSYPELAMPIAIVAGEGDAIVSTAHNSARLNEEIAQAELTVLPGAGHMIQHLSQQVLLHAVRDVEHRALQPPYVRGLTEPAPANCDADYSSLGKDAPCSPSNRSVPPSPT